MLLRRNNQDMLPMVLTLALSSGKLVGSQGVHHEEHYEPSPYRYEYKVHDDKVYLGFGAEEEGDGKDNVVGFYHVQLPDGRLQKVTYTVNGYGGYIADVAYDGEAVHPSYHRGGGHGGGHQFGKSLAQEPFQIIPAIPVESGRSGKAFQQKPKISVQSDRAGKSHFEKQEENNFSGVFFGSSSRHSNSAPSEISENFQRRPSISPLSDRSGKSNLEKLEKPNFSQGFFGSTFGKSSSFPSESEEQKKSIPELNQNTFPRQEDQPSSKRPFTAVENEKSGKSFGQESFQSDGSRISLAQGSFQKQPQHALENERSDKSFVQEQFQRNSPTVVESDISGISLVQKPSQASLGNDESRKSFPQDSLQSDSEISLALEPFQKRPPTALENDRKDKSFVQEPEQISPKPVEESEILENNLDDNKQEEHIFSGGLLGASSLRSNSLPLEIGEPTKSIPKLKQNNFLEPSKFDDISFLNNPFSVDQKRIFKRFDKKEQEESESSTGSKLEEFLKTFKPKSSAFIKLKERQARAKNVLSEYKSGKKKSASLLLEPSKSMLESPRFKPRPIGFGKNHPVLQSPLSDPRDISRLSSSSQKSIDEFLKYFPSRLSKIIQQDSQQKAHTTSSEGTFQNSQNSPPAFDSSTHSSSYPEHVNQSSKPLKNTTNNLKPKSSLIVHRRLLPSELDNPRLS